MTTPQRVETPNRYVILLNVSIRATDIEEARDIIETSEWVSDLSGRQSNVVPIFHALRTGRISQVRLLGLVPSIPHNGEDVFGTTTLFAGMVALFGTAKSKAAFMEYVKSGFWYVGNRVTVHNSSRVYREVELDMSRIML